MIGLALAGAIVAGLILAIAFVPSGETVQDAEDDRNTNARLFVGLCLLAFIALVMVV